MSTKGLTPKIIGDALTQPVNATICNSTNYASITYIKPKTDSNFSLCAFQMKYAIRWATPVVAIH